MTGSGEKADERKRDCILLIDDEADFVDDWAAILRRLGYECVSASSGKLGLEAYQRCRPQIVLTDLSMPEMDGLALLRSIKSLDPEAMVILITAYASIDTAIDATRAGAFDYLRKPFTRAELCKVLQRCSEHRARQMDLSKASAASRRCLDFSSIVGSTEPVRQLIRSATCAAESNANVILTGETGTGKELLARAIHANSTRSGGPYIPVDCTALPEALLESELFGHERGAFTGAVAMQRGLLELADGGTLFLDELEELSLPTQAKLLRVLEERQVRRLGGQTFVNLNLRIIAATNQDISGLVAANKFRGDLFYRLNVLSIRVPPLRDRTGDIPVLAEHFLQTFARRAGRPVQGISEAALLVLEHYPWPGNVRELRNAIERAVTVTTEPYVSPLDLPGEMLTKSQQMPVMFRLEKRKSVENFERQSIAEALTRTQGNVTEAARICGMDRAALHRLMRKYGIESRLYRAPSNSGQG